MQSAPVRLPHSGLTVPHTGYTVTSCRGHRTHDGVAFTATLRRDKKIIGHIENDGNGGPPTFYPNSADGYRLQVHTMEAFAALCADERGVTPSMEEVLDDLVTEYRIGLDIARAAKRGNVALRMMQDHQLDDGPMGWPTPAAYTEAPAALAAGHAQLRAHLLAQSDLTPDALAWWQLWDADASAWTDVTPRPAHLPTGPA